MGFPSGESVTTPVVSNGWVSAEGGQDYQQTMGPKMYAMAQEMARQSVPPAPGSLNQMLASMGAIQPPEKSKAELLAQLAGRHYVNPPIAGGGGKAEAVGMPEYQQKAGRSPRGPKSLGDYLKGG